MNNIIGKSYKVKLFTVVTSIVLVVGLSSCSENKSVEDLFSSASKYKSEHNYTSALLELKNAVRQAPKNAKYRKALGDVHLALGNYLDAEKELEKSRELGIEFAEISSGLAKTYARLDNSKRAYELVDEGASLSEDNYLTLLYYAGITALNNGAIERSQDFLDQAMVFDNSYIQVKLAKAYYHYTNNEFDKGLSILSSLAVDEEFYFEIVLTQGILLFAKKDYAAAKEKFIEFREETPNDSKITLHIINSLLHYESFEEAEKYTDEYLAKYSNSTLALFYKSKIEFQRGEYANAQNNAERAVQQNNELYAAKAVAGLSAFNLEKYEGAYVHLKPLIKYVPDNSPLHAILRVIEAKMGKSVEGSDSLAFSINDTQLLVNASDELIQLGQFNEARSILNDFDQVGEQAHKQLADIGLLKLSIGDEQGFSFLEKAIEKEPSSEDLRMALAMSYFKAGKIENAVTVAKKWQLEFPSNVDAYNLLGMILLGTDDIEGAEFQFQQTLQLEPKNNYVRLYFANKDLNENHLTEALQKVEDILKDSPENFNALSLYYNISALKSNTTDALKRIERAYLNDIDNHVKKYYFASVLYLAKNYEKCIEVLNSWDIDNIEIPRDYFVLLVGAHSNVNAFNEALKANDFWLEKMPNDNVAWFSKLNVLDKLNDLPQALSTVELMLVKFYNLPRLKVLLPHYQILNKQFDKAKISLASIDVNQDNEDFIQGLHGKILFSETKYQRALPKLQQQYKADPNYRNAGFVYTSLLKLNQQSEALSFMQKHLEKYPNDVVTKAFYGQTLLNNDLNTAQTIYQELVEHSPENIVFLNNLAWVEYSLTNYSKALVYAEKANKLSPNQAVILDTLSMAYHMLGEIEKAKMVSAQALNLAPENHEISRNYNLIRGN